MHGGKDWNAEYETRQSTAPVYDLWLDKYREVLETSAHLPVLELGCGTGGDTLYLTERGYSVIGCDISETAITRLRSAVPGARGLVVDMRDGLPFDDCSFQVAVADLCLHYFSWADTVRIVRDIGRVLRPGGVLLCRVNSTADYNFGAGQGEQIEDNYYAVNGNTKRFFDQGQLEALFSGWEILNLREDRMDRYKRPKMLWELAVRQGDGSSV